MKGLIGCEQSQTICKAFRELGYEVYSCDLKPCSGGRPEWHIMEDILKVIEGGIFKTEAGNFITINRWDFMIAHPECTYLTVTANKWLKDQPERESGALVGQKRRDAQINASDFFMKLVNAPIDHIAIENPIGVMSSLYRKPDQIFQPFWFGHPEPKKTCLWLKGFPLLTPTEIIEPEYFISKSGKKLATWYYKPSPSPERQTMRSVTFANVAKAMADQWSKVL